MHCPKLQTRYFIVIIIFVTLVGTGMYFNMLYNSFKDEITSTLAELANEKVGALQDRVQTKLDVVENLALLIGRQEILNQVTVVTNLGEIVENNEFKRMGIIFPSGDVYTTDNVHASLADREYFKQSMKGKTVISDCIEDRFEEGGSINVYSAPILRNKNVQGVLYGASDVSNFQSVLETVNFEGRGYSYLVKADGTILVASKSAEVKSDADNIFTVMTEVSNRNQNVLSELMNKMEAMENGYLSFWNKNSEKYLYYSPLEIHDWYLLTIVPSSLVNERLSFVMQWYFVFGGVILLTVILLALYIQHMQTLHQKKVEALAYIDPLTGGRTATKFRIDASEVIKSASDGTYAVVSLDVDKFKYINNLFGFEEGNEVIKIIDRVLKDNMSAGELYGHKDADNFFILLKMRDKSSLILRLERISNQVKELCEERVKRVEIILSMGVYQIENKDMPIEDQIDNAQLPRKSIKGIHNIEYAFYDESLKKTLLYEKDIENRMADAIRKKDFVVFYQPKYYAADARLSGAEALVRWKKKDGVYLPPGDFIPVFEKNGFIVELDKYVFETVCKDLKIWIDEIGLENVKPVSINLSRLHLYNHDLVEEYCAIQQKYNIPPYLLQLELTESVLFDNTSEMLVIIDQFHKKGFDILMDDFGSGYSSLNMLKDVPVDVIKLDKGFIDDLTSNAKGRRIIESVVVLAQNLSMKVVAEGVETQEQFEFLKNVSCDEIQGYYFAKPMEKSEYEQRLFKARAF